MEEDSFLQELMLLLPFFILHISRCVVCSEHEHAVIINIKYV